MLREVLEDVLRRGERLKKDVVSQVLSSAALKDLVRNEHFAQTVARVIETKAEISKILRRNIHEALKMMSIPNREQIEAYERRVQRLEHEIDHLGRRFMARGFRNSRSSSRKSPKRHR